MHLSCWGMGWGSPGLRKLDSGSITIPALSAVVSDTNVIVMYMQREVGSVIPCLFFGCDVSSLWRVG